MVKEYAAADRVRVLREAPAPSDEQANQVGAFGGQLAALQRAFDDYEESAFSVDADSGRSKTKKKSKKKKDDANSRGRNKHRSKSRGRSKSTDEPKVKNKYKHCNEERPYAGKHDEENVSTTKSIKDGVLAKYARKWTYNSNVDRNTLRTWADLPAVHQKQAAAEAKAKVATPAMNDGVGAQTMENGLRYGERKLTNL